jgi:glycosyltransferase involved in cell wall biosynthesis
VDVLDLPKNGGKAAAVRAGVRLAMEHGADYVGYWDADLATPLSAIGDFVRVLDRRRGIDAVIGCRLPMLGHAIHRQRKRAFLGRVFARTASQVLGIPIRDTQCGAKLFRVCPWTVGAFERPFLTRWIFDVEILARIAQFARGGHAPHLAECIYEQPLDEWQDVAGSRLRARDFLKAPAEMAAIYLRYLSPIASRPPELAPLPSMVISMEQAQRDEAEVRRRAA